jgi:hypothetical protein
MHLAHCEWSARGRRSQSLAADLEEQEYDLAEENFPIDLVEKIVMKVFKICDLSILQFCDFEISVFGNLTFCISLRSARPLRRADSETIQKQFV